MSDQEYLDAVSELIKKRKLDGSEVIDLLVNEFGERAVADALRGYQLLGEEWDD